MSKIPGDSRSALILGGSVTKYYTGPMNYVPLLNTTYWLIQMGDAYVNDQALNICSDASPCRAIVDSGTSLIAGPAQQIMEITTKIQVSKDCSNLGSLPNVTIAINGVKYLLTPQDYVIKMTMLGQSQCVSGFMPIQLPPSFGKFFILGDVFMSSYYTEFDYGNKRVGLAKAIQQPAQF